MQQSSTSTYGAIAGYLLVAIAALLLHPRAAGAQGTAFVQGTVHNEANGEALAGVNVYVEETGRGTESGANGHFEIVALVPGRYTLVASRVGFRTIRQPITVDAGAPVHVELALVPQPIPLDEVLAEADRAYSVGSSRAVRNLDFLVRPMRSAQDLLALAPGLVTAQHAGGGKAEQIFLRGFDADHGTDVNITVDGMPVNMVSHGHGQGYADLHFVFPELIQGLEVFKGPYSAAFGNFATAGSITFATRDHLDDNMVRLERGAFETSSLTALYQIPSPGPHEGAYLAGQIYRTDGPFESPQGFHRASLFGKFHAHLSEEARLAVSVSGFSSAWDASGQIPARAVRDRSIGRFGFVDDLEGGTTARQNVNVTYDASRGGSQFQMQGYATRYNFKLFSNFTFFLEDEQLGDMIEQVDNRQILGLNGRYRFHYPLGKALATTTLGGGFRADAIEVMLLKSPSRLRAQALNDAAISEHNLYLWMQEEVIVSPLLRFQLGLRWDYFTYNVDDRLEGQPAPLPHASGYAQQAILSPKMSVVVSPLRTLDLFANVGTGFHSNDARAVIIEQRSSDLMTLYGRQGMSAAEIEARLAEQHFLPHDGTVSTLPRAVGAELGFRSRLASRLNAGVAAWWLDLEREFVYVGDGGFTELGGRSRRYGLDVEARLGLASWLVADADVNFSEGVLRDEPEGANAIPLAPRVTSTGGLTALHPDGYEGSLRFVHIGSRPANEDGSIIAEGYTMLSLLGAHRIGPVRVTVVVENILDASWNEAQFATESRLPGEAASVSELHFTPGNPRNVRLGLAYLF